MIHKGCRAIALAAFFISLVAAAVLHGAASAHADFFNYPCQQNGQGIGVDIKVIADISGQFCDGPTQINLSHLHCDSGGASIAANGIGLGAIPFIGGSTLGIGGIGGGSLGGGGQGCTYKCPDGTPAPQPNPPWMSSSIPYLDVNRIIKAHRAFCVVGNHLLAQGPTSALVLPEEGDPDLSKPDEPNLIPHPAAAPEGEAPEAPPEAPPAEAPHGSD